MALASGKADRLTGRFIHALDDLDALIEHADEILAKDLQSLRLEMFDKTL